jgi:hypothetical protein
VARMLRDRCDTGGMVSSDGVSDCMAALSGFGNAIHVELAAEFIRAYLDVRS